MNKHIDIAEFLPKPATRERVPLNLALEGPPGGGKTGSALLLAQGIQDAHGGPIRLIDTEARRSTKFLGERIGDSRPFAFDIVDFRPPFRADRYKAALQAALQTTPAPCCVIVDSISDEHEGIGGRLDWHEEEVTQLLTRMRRDPKDWQQRQKVDQSGWQPASAARKDLIRWAMQVDQCPIIWTIRAREKTRPIEKEKNGRTVTEPTNLGFVPIAPVELVHAMDLVCLLPPRADGTPLWRTDRQFEDFVLKLPEWFKPMFAQPGPITAEHGRMMELWAAGKVAPAPVKHVSRETESVSQEGAHRADCGEPLQMRDDGIRVCAKCNGQWSPGFAAVCPNAAPTAIGKITPKRRTLRDVATEQAEKGAEHFRAWVEELSEEHREWVADRWEEFAPIADAADTRS